MKKKYRKIILATMVMLTFIVGLLTTRISGPKGNKEVLDKQDEDIIILEEKPNVETECTQEDKEDSSSEDGTRETKKDINDNATDDENDSDISLGSEKNNKKDTSDKIKDENKNDETTSNKVQYITCSITIDCSVLIDGKALKENGNENKQIYVPEDGKVVSKIDVKVKENSSVYDVLKAFCKKKNIQMEASYTAGLGTYYVEGINHLYQYDGGSGSGWVFFVNGSMLNYGASDAQVSQDDEIVWMYTLDYGYDVCP